MIIFFNKGHRWHLTNPHIIQMSCPLDTILLVKQKESESFQGICLNVGRSTPPEGLSWQSPDVLELGGKR